MSDTAKLSLEILEDLKPSDNTVVTKPVSEEEKRNYEIKEMDKKEEKDSDFYSNTYTFSKKDFFGDGELDESKKSNIVWKVILVILTIVIIVLATIYALNYFNIDVIKFFK